MKDAKDGENVGVLTEGSEEALCVAEYKVSEPEEVNGEVDPWGDGSDRDGEGLEFKEDELLFLLLFEWEFLFQVHYLSQMEPKLIKGYSDFNFAFHY